MTIKINGSEIKQFNFNGGEVQIHVPCILTDHNIVYAELRNSDDIMALILTANAIKRDGGILATLEMPYVPYARQDRVCNKGEALSIEAFAGIINSLGFNKVEIADPHSDVTIALIKNCEVETQSDIFLATYNNDRLTKVLENRCNDLLIVSPDAGAEKKTLNLAKSLKVHKVAFARKVRDASTGSITATEIDITRYSDVEKILIADDICDGGRTFIELAKKLREQTDATLYLYVTHGIFSKGLNELKEYYKNIYCYNVFDKEGVEKFNNTSFAEFLIELE